MLEHYEKGQFPAGTEVIYVSEKKHKEMPQCYPAPGTIGIVVQEFNPCCMIQWPKKSTSDNDQWYAHKKDIKAVTNDMITWRDK